MPAATNLDAAFAKHLNLAILATRGFDVLGEDPSAGDEMLADTHVALAVAHDWADGKVQRENLADVLGREIADARGVEFEPGGRFATQVVAEQVILAWYP